MQLTITPGLFKHFPLNKKTKRSIMTNDDGVVTWHNLLKHLNENELEKCIHWQRSWKIGTNFQKKKLIKIKHHLTKNFKK